jgi:transcription termination factor Rho
MELVLDRKLQERRVFPAIDIQRSGTRREELLLDDTLLKQVWTMRRMLAALVGHSQSGEPLSDAMQLLMTRMSKTKDNKEFLTTLTKDIV